MTNQNAGLVWDRVEASGSPKYLIKEQTVLTRQTSDKRHKPVACGVSGSKYCFALLAYTRESDSKIQQALLLGLSTQRTPLGLY